MNPENDLITIQVQKDMTSLYKTFLEIIEDIHSNNNIMLGKIQPQLASQINYFTDEYHSHLRKRILDSGNDKIRELTAFMDYFDFIINKEKVEQAAKLKRISKKIIINSPIEVK